MSFADLECELLELLAGLDADVEAKRIEAAKSKSRKAASLLQSLRLEARTISSPAEKEACGVKLKAHETAIGDANRRIDAAASSSLLGGASRSRAGGGEGKESEATREGKARAAAVTSKLSEGTGKLKDAQKTLEETITVAEGTMVGLHEQRETMTRIKGRVDETNSLADEARAITQRMSSFWGGLFGSSSSSKS